jgi:hypothetical protein
LIGWRAGEYEDSDDDIFKNLGKIRKESPMPSQAVGAALKPVSYFFTVAGINFVDLNYLHHPF